MSEQPEQPREGITRLSANDRFKQGFGNWFWGSLAGATVLHFVLFAFLPAFSVADASFSGREFEAIELPPEVEIPPPPEQIPRPATPVVASADIDEDITIAPTTFEDNPIERLPPPPAAGTDLSAAPAWTPYDVAPRLVNSTEIERALARHYPPTLRDAGIGGTVLVWFFIDETGKVVRHQIHTSSGYEALDEAALRVADLYRFTPAYNRDRPVPVWVAQPITFQSR